MPTGTGNLGVDPQLLGDGYHLAPTSPCLGAGTVSVISGTDIDGQPWNSPPAIGCDEWHPQPVIGAQPSYLIGVPPYGLTFNVIVAGQLPFNYFWSLNGTPIQDDGHHANSGTANLVVNNFDPDDAGIYQVVASNAFGVVTSQVAQVVIHAVDAAGANPVSPYSTWATAATTIQDAVDSAAAGDIVLATNGVYATGGRVMAGNLTNRVVLNKPVTVTSVNGYSATVIQGAWDPASTNGTGPGAVRCLQIGGGGVLNGFTLRNGSTRATGDYGQSGPLETGGGVWCPASGGVVANCLLTNDSAYYGGGIAYGTLNNSLVVHNLATYGGGAYYANLNHCTVVNNFTTTSTSNRGAGDYFCNVTNSIVLNNFDNWPWFYSIDNHANPCELYFYSCTYPLTSLIGTGNINGIANDPQFLDEFHIASTSPCRGAGSAVNTSGTDLDGEPWANPPSMGCDEVVVSNLVGSLSVSLAASQTNLLVNQYAIFSGIITGHASRVVWLFGNGPTIMYGASMMHQWTNSGDYTVTVTAYNNDNPVGVSASVVVHVLAPIPLLQSPMVTTNAFWFQFNSVSNVNYTIQDTTNLVPPVTWQTVGTIPGWGGNIRLEIITNVTNPAGFYRVMAW